MQNQRQSFLSNGRLVLLALAALALLTVASALGAPQHAKGGKEAVVFPHMDAAMGYLKAALTELQQGEPVFAGHREKAIQDVNAAIADAQKAMDAYLAAHPNAPRNQAVPETPSTAGKQFPHMEGALKLLQQAEVHFNEALRIYDGKRVGGLDETKAAIAEIQTGLKDAHK
ncbi:MAG TPA: hypothetical protein VG206_15880 [Terriglobia bacterium]|nr:hypothetical protein [Terriglobia bacterium]